MKKKTIKELEEIIVIKTTQSVRQNTIIRNLKDLVKVQEELIKSLENKNYETFCKRMHLRTMQIH